MLSKGIDCFAFLSDSEFNILFSKPSNWGTQTLTTLVDSPNLIVTHNFQMHESDIPLGHLTGQFEWAASHNNLPLANYFAHIASLPAILEKSNMGNIMQTPSLISENFALSYGYFDAGPCWGMLTPNDQVYVYLTRNYSNWMTDLCQAAPAMLGCPFSVFALPGAHDAGTFDLTAVKQIIEANSGAFLEKLLLDLAIDEVLSPLETLRAIINLACTQKDDITTLLNLGVRYFDFRPGYCVEGLLPGQIFHQHKYIPGYPYQSFLEDVFRWLVTHPGEFVVISANFQGFHAPTMQPPEDVLNAMVEAAQARAGAEAIGVGNKADLNTSIGELLAANKRLIFLNQISQDKSENANKYDSYCAAYRTTNVEGIITALNGMAAVPTGCPDGDCVYTVLQLQGTANATGGGLFDAITAMSDASSPIMSTKAQFDCSTYPWLLANVPTKFSNSHLIVFLNDFADNVLTKHAIEITAQRAGIVRDRSSEKANDQG